MESLGHAVSTASALKNLLEHEVSAAKKGAPVPKKEQIEANKHIDAAKEAISKTLADVQESLGNIRAYREMNKAAKGAGTGEKGSEPDGKAPARVPIPDFGDPRIPVPPVKPPTAGDGAAKTVTKFGLRLPGQENVDDFSQSSGKLSAMAEKMGPIVDTFEEILRKSYTEQYSATLDTVPILGFKNGKIRCLATKPGDDATSVKLQWEAFSDVPAGFELPELTTGENPMHPGVHIFPHRGDLFVSNGRAVWRKEKRDLDDDQLSGAVDNYSALFHPGFSKVGANVLPEARLRNVVPFIDVSSTGELKGQHLMALGEDSGLWMLSDGGLAESAEWLPLTFDNQFGINDAWEHVCLWNSRLVAVTTEGGKTFSQNLVLDLAARTYRVSHKQEIEPVLQLTATEQGPVALHPDGTLRIRRIDEDKVDGSEEEPEDELPNVEADLFKPEPYTWTTLTAADGTTNIGISSAGVILNLNLLTRVLRARYIETQLALVDPVLDLQAFADIHDHFLQYAKSSVGNPSLASEFVAYAQVWAQLMSSNMAASSDTVVLMARQLEDVSRDIERQLDKLAEDLIKAKAALEEAKGQLKSARALFISTLVIGILAGLAAAFAAVTGNVYAAIALGVIATGCLVVAGVSKSPIVEARELVASEAAKVEALQQSKTQLAYISARFVSIEDSYEGMKTFWGGLKDETKLLSTTDSVAIQHSLELGLNAPFIYAAALERTGELRASCHQFLDLLNAQGITAGRTSRTSTTSMPPIAAAEAKACLARNDLAACTAVLQASVTAREQHQAAREDALAKTGLFFDLPKLRSGAGAWRPSARASNRLVEKAGRAVASMLVIVADLGDAGDAGLRAGALDTAGLRKACSTAMSYAARADHALTQVASRHVSKLTWQRLVQQVGLRLSRVNAILAAGDVADMQWHVMSRDARETLAILALEGVHVDQKTAVGRGGKRQGRGQQDDEALKREQLVAALKPAPELAARLAEQASDSTTFFHTVDALARNGILDGLYGDTEKPEDEDNGLRPSLADLADTLQARFAEAGALEIDGLNLLSARAQLARIHANALAAGDTSVADISALQTELATQTREAGDASYGYLVANVRDWFHAITARMQEGLDKVVQEISELDEELEELEDARREAIFDVISTTVALAFATVSGITALAALPATVATRIAAQKFAKVGFKLAKKAVKTALDGASLAEINAAIIQLKGTRSLLLFHANQLKELLARVDATEVNLGGLNDQIEAMEDRIMAIRDDGDQFQGIQLTNAEVEDITAAWQDVDKHATALRDVFNGFGITS